MRSREQAEQIIAALYGTFETDTAPALIARLMEELGTAAFTDEALIRLAGLQEDFHEAEVSRLERAWRREQRGY